MMEEQSKTGLDSLPPPPNYSESTNVPLSLVDFLPQCLQQGGFAKQREYEKFPVLLQRANQWLADHPMYKVRTCESTEVALHSWANPPDVQRMLFTESGSMSTSFVRGLRLWIQSKGPDDPPGPQQLGYLNVVPACTSPPGMFKSPTFENFGQTVTKLNEMFKQNPLPGRMLNVETMDVKFQSYSGNVDPDICFWIKSADLPDIFLNIIRVFYEGGPPAHEAIGCVDFVPSCLTPGSMFRVGSFEPLSAVAAKANAWMAANPGLPVINVQSINYKVSGLWDGSGHLDTLKTYFMEAGSGATLYLRIFRVVYGCPFEGSRAISRSGISHLSYKTFMPVQLTTGAVITAPEFESLSDTMKRAMAWLQMTGAKVISGEAVPVLMERSWSRGATVDSEVSHCLYSGSFSKVWLMAVRVYLDGVYTEPPPEALPPIPAIQQTPDDPCCFCSIQ